MVACVPPSARSSASSRIRSSDSGVVFTAGSTRPARRYSMVPTRAVVNPAARSTESIRNPVVVFPLVPVMPVRATCSSGLP